MGLKVGELFGDLKLDADDALAAMEKFQAKLKKAQEGLGKTEDKTEKLGKKFKKLGNTVGDLAGPAFKRLGQGLAIVTGALAVGVAGLVAYTSTWITSVQDMNEAADRLGIPAASLERLGFAAEASGGNVEQVTAAIETLATNLADMVRNDAGPAKEAFEDLGLTLKDIEGRNIEEQFGIISEAIGGLETTSQQTAVSLKLLGGAGSGLGALLGKSAKEVKALTDRADELGIVVGVEGRQAVQDFTDAFRETKAVLRSLGNVIGRRLVPTIRDALGRFRDWLIVNKDVIATRLDEWLKRIVDFLEAAGPAAVKMVQGIGEITDKMGGLTSAIKGAATTWATFEIALSAITSGHPAVAGLAILAGAVLLITQRITAANEARKKLLAQASTKLEQKGLDVGTLAAGSKSELVLARNIVDIEHRQRDLKAENKKLRKIEGQIETIRQGGDLGLSITDLQLQAQAIREVRDESAAQLQQDREMVQEQIDARVKRGADVKRLADKESQDAIDREAQFTRGILREHEKAKTAAEKAALEREERRKKEEAAEREALKSNVKPELTLNELIAASTGQGISGAVGTFRPSGPGTTINQFTVNNTVGPTTVEIVMDGLENASANDVAGELSDRLGDVLDARIREAFEEQNRQEVG